MTSLDEMINLPTDLQFKLLINRLPEAVVMVKVINIQQSFNTSLKNLLKVWLFNVRNIEDEVSLVFSEKDMSQVLVRPLKFMSFYAIHLQYVTEFLSGKNEWSAVFKGRRDPEILSDPGCGQEILHREAQVHEPQHPR